VRDLRTSCQHYIDFHSEDCAVEATAVGPRQGLRVVTYCGERYVVVGVYLACCEGGGRELRYIVGRAEETLRAVDRT
jgi:hypothetical protein